MSVATEAAHENIKRAILAALQISPAKSLSMAAIRTEVETAQGIVLSMDKLRSMVSRMEEQDLLKEGGGLVQITEYGTDVVFVRAEMP